jgi:hypothetical protein
MWEEQNYINNIALNFCMDNASEGNYRVAKMPLMVKKVLREEKGFRQEDAQPLRMSVDEEREASSLTKINLSDCDAEVTLGNYKT